MNCRCGCGGMTRGGRFLPGHDAKLKAKLIRQYRSDNPIEREDAETQAGQLGWSHLIVRQGNTGRKQASKPTAKPTAQVTYTAPQPIKLRS